ncbi:hypothetical protein TNCV_2239061 [Trichonephila clavipes]|nr:hypothetical protein TNCV_2239061 [Trichonephila clavipes]
MRTFNLKIFNKYQPLYVVGLNQGTPALQRRPGFQRGPKPMVLQSSVRFLGPKIRLCSALPNILRYATGLNVGITSINSNSTWNIGTG